MTRAVSLASAAALVAFARAGGAASVASHPHAQGAASLNGGASRPNFIIIMADDLDLLLNGTSAMTTLQKELVKGGTSLRNYVSSPICCPSRTSTLSGRYSHNLGVVGGPGWCGSFHEAGSGHENATWVKALRDAGYRTASFGKYTNAYTAFCTNRTVHVPADYERFYAMCSDSVFFGNAINDQGTLTHLGADEYLTNAIGNASISWLTEALQGPAPVWAYIAPHAPHVPATPAHEYENAPLPGGVYTSPRTPSWDVVTQPSAHWLEATREPLSDALVSYSDELYVRRMRTMFSVDDVIAAVFDTIRAAGAENNTYVFFTSDHGYNLGEHRFPSGKFHHFEHDVRVPFHVTGPGVQRGVSFDAPLTMNLDIGPSILELAGVAPPPGYVFDGRSFASLLAPTGSAAAAAGIAAGAPASSLPGIRPIAGRDRLVTEYYGMGFVWRGPCTNGSAPCPNGVEALLDADSNSWSALRIRNATHDVEYVEWRGVSNDTLPMPSETNYTAAFDLASDPWQLVNAAPSGSVAGLSIAALQAELWRYADCSGDSCA